MSDEMVSVPKALLAEVLSTALGDNFSTEQEFAVGTAEHEAYKAERDKIAELQRIAGIEP